MKSVYVNAPAPLVKAGIESIVAASASLELAEDERSADVIVLDLERPPVNGAVAEPGAAPLVLLVNDPSAPWILEALRMNARAILPRNASPDAIAAAIEAVASGLLALDRSVVDAIVPIPAVGKRNGTLERVTEEKLTPREIEVLAMLAEGLGNKMIASRMGISEHTVKFHIGQIFAKLGVQSRTEAVTLGARSGLIML